VDDRDAVAQALRLVEVVGREQQREPAAVAEAVTGRSSSPSRSNDAASSSIRAAGVRQRLACSARLRRPESERSTTGSWKTTLETLRAAIGSAATSWPASRADPLVGVTVVVSIPTVVDFPAPFGPSSPNTSPGATENEAPFTASIPPGYTFVRASTSIIDSSRHIACVRYVSEVTDPDPKM
jgi:hypothetical protein